MYLHCGLPQTEPYAQGVLDPVIVPRPMSQGCAGLIDSVVHYIAYGFLKTSAHENVALAGCVLDTCRIPAGLPLCVAN